MNTHHITYILSIILNNTQTKLYQTIYFTSSNTKFYLMTEISRTSMIIKNKNIIEDNNSIISV